MGLLYWIVVGLIAGWATGKIMKGTGYGALMDIVIGIVGGIVGGALFKAAGGEGINSFSLYSILVAFVGATVLLFAWGLVTRHDA